MELFESSQEDRDIDIKIERLQTLEGTSELGDQPFVRYNVTVYLPLLDDVFPLIHVGSRLQDCPFCHVLEPCTKIAM